MKSNVGICRHEEREIKIKKIDRIQQHTNISKLTRDLKHSTTTQRLKLQGYTVEIKRQQSRKDQWR